jgi:hypothetical protein
LHFFSPKKIFVQLALGFFGCPDAKKCKKKTNALDIIGKYSMNMVLWK